jgi:hypothetical protein
MTATAVRTPVRARRPTVLHDPVTCGVCTRTLLTGEQATFFRDPDNGSHLVCELCAPVARRLGWSREEGCALVR